MRIVYEQMTFLSELASTISDNNICTWYYVLFLINFGVFALLLLGFIWIFITKNKIFMNVIGGNFIFWIISMFISLTSGLFFYLMCDRALLKN
jgi:hypothetical protein